MSGILDRIVARRRASARSRLGPPSTNGNGAVAPWAPPTPPAAGTAPNGSHATVVPEVPPAPEPPAPEPPAPEPPAPEPPAAEEPPAPDQPSPTPGFVERGRIRRRARYLRQLRELQYRDLGGFLVELRRRDRERPDLVAEKLEHALQTDAELRTLERALNEGQPMREIRQPGIGGACEHCGAVHGSSDRFCASCGEKLAR